MPASPWDRQKDEEGAIKPGALNLTIISTLLAIITAGAGAFTDLFDTILGENASAGLKVALFVAIIAAATVIIVADLFARSHATAAQRKLTLDVGAGQAKVSEDAVKALTDDTVRAVVALTERLAADAATRERIGSLVGFPEPRPPNGRESPAPTETPGY